MTGGPSPHASKWTDAELQTLVIRSWEHALKRVGISPADNFFALGGHSLVAIRVSGRLTAELGRQIPYSLILQHPQAKGLCAALVEFLASDGHTSLSADSAD